VQLIRIVFIILFAAYTVNRRILVYSARFFVVLKHCRNRQSIFLLKIVTINLIGGAIVLFAAYSVYGRISVRFSFKICVILQHCLHQNFAKIVLINSLGGTPIPYAAYTAF